uniref:Peptidase S1 domain-containing protein n=1 Tax=Clastoptera arizonana TaxID=38151 RepID=A0A1B6DB04_9HEMI
MTSFVKIIYLVVLTAIVILAFEKKQYNGYSERSEIFQCYNESINSVFYSKRILKNFSMKTKSFGQRRVFGGTNVKKIESYPFMAFLVIHKNIKNNNYHMSTRDAHCGATILSPLHVLTAAHCAVTCVTWECNNDLCSKCETKSPNRFEVLVGDVIPKFAKFISRVKKVMIHPKFQFSDRNERCIYNNDLAILQLIKPLPLSSKIQKAVLPHKVWHRFHNCKILGWGSTSNPDYSPPCGRILQMAPMNQIDTTTCLKYLKISNSDATPYRNFGLCNNNSICLYDKKRVKGICYGDSGSPLICNGELAGVVSWSPDRGKCLIPYSPNVFSRVDLSMRWIKKVLKK